MKELFEKYGLKLDRIDTEEERSVGYFSAPSICAKVFYSSKIVDFYGLSCHSDRWEDAEGLISAIIRKDDREVVHLGKIVYYKFFINEEAMEYFKQEAVKYKKALK